jgi:hypothetical protein
MMSFRFLLFNLLPIIVIFEVGQAIRVVLFSANRGSI